MRGAANDRRRDPGPRHRPRDQPKGKRRLHEDPERRSVLCGESAEDFIRSNPYNEHVTFHNFMQKVRKILGELGGANIFFVAIRRRRFGRWSERCCPSCR
jgi:hypothetical protein